MESRPSLFRVDQVGYAAGLPVRAAALTDAPVRLTDAEGRCLREFQVIPIFDEASGDHMALADLGALPEGNYYLKTDQETRGFSVTARPWRGVTNALIKGLYFQRCGCALSPEYAGPYAHAACHTAPCQDWEHPAVRRKVPGGWHDAGDYGKYVGPGAVAAAHLLYAWALFPAGCGDELNIPESGGGVPDILSEARWELDWLLRMQRTDGAFHHKLTKAQFAAFIMPEDDLEQEYLMPVSTCATGAACACLALASRVWRTLDPGFSARALAAARKAWAWLAAHPDFIPFRNPEGVRTGQYGDRSDRDERFWAACELFAATRETAYREAAEALYAEDMNLAAFGWADVSGLGAICCLFDPDAAMGGGFTDKLKANFLRRSETALAMTRQSGYGTALPAQWYIWGSILPIMSNAMAMLLAFRLTGREDMRLAALDQLHYALGLNALDVCFVTGFGEHPVMHPHHRPSGADNVDAPVPGLISGGPNKAFPYPSTRERLGPDVPPAKYFLDETPSADTNEIAVYWNTPAIFVAAGFNAMMNGKEITP